MAVINVVISFVFASLGLLAVQPPAGTPAELVGRVLELAAVNSTDLVLDLGCGDARILIQAAREYRSRGICVERDEKQIRAARDAAIAAGVDGQIEFRHQDIFDARLDEASVIYLYLDPQSNSALLPKLRALRKGTRIVSFAFTFGRDWEPTSIQRITDTLGIVRSLYLWVIE